MKLYSPKSRIYVHPTVEFHCSGTADVIMSSADGCDLDASVFETVDKYLSEGNSEAANRLLNGYR